MNESAQPKPQNVSVRLPGELIAHLDAIAQAETQRTGYEIGRAELIRAMLTRAVAAHLASTTEARP